MTQSALKPSTCSVPPVRNLVKQVRLKPGATLATACSRRGAQREDAGQAAAAREARERDEAAKLRSSVAAAAAEAQRTRAALDAAEDTADRLRRRVAELQVGGPCPVSTQPYPPV